MRWKRPLIITLLVLAGCSADGPDEASQPDAIKEEPLPAPRPPTPAESALKRARGLAQVGDRLGAVRATLGALALAGEGAPARGKALGVLARQVGLAWHRRSAGAAWQPVEGLILLLEDGALSALDPATGADRWRLAPIGQAVVRPVLLDGPALYVATSPRAAAGPGSPARVLRLDPGTGAVRARVDLPVGLTSPRLLRGRTGALCVEVKTACCDDVRSALMIADDLAELPEPPDACTSGGRATAGAAPRLELPWECGALAGCAGELAVDWLADLDRTDNGVRVLGQTAVLDRPEGVYAVDLATCKVLWRLPLRATPAGLTPRFVLLRAHWGAAGGLLGLDRTRIQDAARGRPPWWEPDAGPLEVRVGVGRTAPLRAGPDRQAAEVGEVPDGGHLLFDLMSPRRSLGQPFYRLFREPAVPGGELPERWIWGGDVVPVDTAARWTPDRCQALAWRGRRRTLRDATIVP